MVDQINDLLRKICRKLSGGYWFNQGACNYAVDVKLFHKKANPNLDGVELIEHLFPNSVVGAFEKSNLFELVSVVKECFEFNGDEGSYPNRKYIVSEKFKEDLNKLLEEITTLFSENLGVSKFWLKSGHPFYPVYWEYAFLIRKANYCFVLIGSSSD